MIPELFEYFSEKDPVRKSSFSMKKQKVQIN